MDSALTNDASMSRVLTDRVDCREWNDGQCEYGQCVDKRCIQRRCEKEWCIEKPSGPREVSRGLVDREAMR